MTHPSRSSPPAPRLTRTPRQPTPTRTRVTQTPGLARAEALVLTAGLRHPVVSYCGLKEIGVLPAPLCTTFIRLRSLRPLLYSQAAQLRAAAQLRLAAGGVRLRRAAEAVSGDGGEASREAWRGRVFANPLLVFILSINRHDHDGRRWRYDYGLVFF